MAVSKITIVSTGGEGYTTSLKEIAAYIRELHPGIAISFFIRNQNDGNYYSQESTRQISQRILKEEEVVITSDGKIQCGNISECLFEQGKIHFDKLEALLGNKADH